MSTLHVIHLDMDAFFASVEQRDNPELKGKPVIVGGNSESRGVVSTASYEAREFGIHSGMPAREAKRLCATAVFLPVNMKKYQEISRSLRKIFYRFTDLVEPLSVDEAFMDVQHRDAVQIGKRLKEVIQEELELTASVGISYNKFLAKMASDMEKPDGFTIIDPNRALKILPEMPVRKLWGIGPKTENELNRVGLYTFADIGSADLMLLQKVLGKRAQEIKLLAKGIDHRVVEPKQPAKSYGEETTLSRDTSDKTAIVEYLHDFSLVLSERLQSSGIKAKTVTVKIRFDDFTDISRSRTNPEPDDSAEYIFEIANSLFERISREGHKVRLIGLQVSGFLMPNDPEQIWFDFLHL